MKAVLWIAGVLLSLAGCATPPPQPPADGQALAPAVAAATDDLLAQAALRRSAVERALARWTPKILRIEALVQSSTSQQTVATHEARRGIERRVQEHHPAYRVLPFTPDGPADLSITGSLDPVTDAEGRPQRGRQALRLDLTDLRSGLQLASTRVSVVDAAMDSTPLPFFQDSPVVMGPRAGAGPALAAGSPTERSQAAARLDQAMLAYNAGQYEAALSHYEAARNMAGADPMQTFAGLYLTLSKLGRAEPARLAFARLVGLGLSAQSLGLKLLFKPGSVDFWPDSLVSQPYPGWLQEIALQVAEAEACVDVVGHSSRTGSAEFNDQLSLQRAEAVRQKLIAHQAKVATRVLAQGSGWRENLVGSGTDDAYDAIDRRVEFKVAGCR